jgi:phosphatidate phosphatase PAH1
VIARKPEVFKMAALQDIQRIFQIESQNGRAKPFYAGFGNRITDALSYRSVDIPSSRIFTIDAYGDVVLELLELAGYKSSCVLANPLPSNAQTRMQLHCDDGSSRPDVPAHQSTSDARVHRLQLLARPSTEC